MSKIDGVKVIKKNQLHNAETWNLDNIRFSDPEFTNIKVENAPDINFVRVNLLTVNEKQDEEGNTVVDENGNAVLDSTTGDLILKFPKSFCFGVSQGIDPKSKEVTGHSISLAMWEREGATEEQIKITTMMEELIEKCKDHVMSITKSEPMKKLKKQKLEKSELKAMNKLLYWKTDENGDKVAGVGPTFSPKLIEYKARTDKQGNVIPAKMGSIFYSDEVDEEGNPMEVDPFEYLSTKDKKCYFKVTPAIKFDSIFIGGGSIYSIQTKVTEADIEKPQVSSQRLLHNRHNITVSNKTAINVVKSVNPLLASTSEESKPEGKVAVDDELVDEDDKPKKKKTLKKKSEV